MPAMCSGRIGNALGASWSSASNHQVQEDCYSHPAFEELIDVDRIVPARQ